MPSERLRLEAEMKDNASPAVKKLRGELEALKTSTADMRSIAKLNGELAKLRKETGDINVSPGMKAAQQWFKVTGDTAAGFMKSGGGVAGVMSSVGLGALGAAGSLAAFVQQMKEAGARSLDMKELARQTGVTTEYLSKFQSAGESVGLSAGTMNQALQVMADQLARLKANAPSQLFDFLTATGWTGLNKKLKTDDTAQALDDILKQLDQIKDPAIRRDTLGKLGLPPELEAIYGHGGYKGFAELMAKQQSLTINPEVLAQAQALREAQKEFNRELERFETTIAPPFIKAMTSLVELGTKSVEMFSHPGSLVPKVGKLSPEEAEKLKKGREDFDKNMGWNPLNWFHFGKRASFDGAGAGGGLLHMASMTSGGIGSGDGVDMLAAGTKKGFLDAYREITGMGSAASGTDAPGLMRAAYTGTGGGFGAGTGGRAQSDGNGGPLEDTGPDGAIGGPGFNTRGVRNKNIGNIGYGAWAKAHGAIGAAGTDTGHGVAVFPSFAAGAAAAGALALEKYNGGKKTIDALIAGQHGWTPGNHAAAANIARSMGLSPFADAHLDSSEMMEKFKHGLAAQELGPNGAKYAFQKMGAGAVSGTLGAGGAGAVDIAKSLAGVNDTGAARALGHYMHSGAWCADFVNGALAKAGGRGTGNAMARSFFGWGRHVGASDAMKGDVLVKGSHVGFATGAPVMHNGQMMIPMISGNHGHRVGEGWARMSEYEVRRARGLDDTGSITAAARAQASASHVHLEIEHPHATGVRVKRSSGPITAALRPSWRRHDFSPIEEA